MKIFLMDTGVFVVTTAAAPTRQPDPTVRKVAFRPGTDELCVFFTHNIIILVRLVFQC